MFLIKHLLRYSGIYCWLHNEHDWPVKRPDNERVCNICGKHQVWLNGKWKKL